MSQHLATLGRKNSLLRITNWQRQTQGEAAICFNWLVSEGKGKEERRASGVWNKITNLNTVFFFLTWGEKNLAEVNQKALTHFTPWLHINHLI